jgi:predicted phosphate transport protein (TIGR00153 family)
MEGDDELSDKLLTWFGKRRQTKAVQLMQSHLSLTTRAVEELGKALEYKIHRENEQAEASIARVSRMEEEADSIRREIATELTAGEIPPHERDDLLHLSRDIDWIADWSKESGRILCVAPVDRLPDTLAKKAIEMVEIVKETAYAVRTCIEQLSERPKEAIRLADQVEDLEEKVDALYMEIRGLYPTMDFSKVNPGEVFLIGQLFDAIENITDWCENTIDQVRLLAVRML